MTYYLEQSACFSTSLAAPVLESNTCGARSGAGVVQTQAPWSDGTWWLDFDNLTQLGWLELDGTPFPPLEAYPTPLP